MQIVVMSEGLLLRDQSQFKLEGGGGRCGGEIGGPSIFFGWNMGGLKMPKDDLGP